MTSEQKNLGELLAENEALRLRLAEAEETLRASGNGDLRRSEERLALATSATQIGLFDLDLVSNRVLWSQTHEAIFGYAAASGTTSTTSTATREYDNTKWSDRVHPDDLPLLEVAQRNCLEQRQPLKVQYRIIWPDGSLHWVETKGIFHCDGEGRAKRLLGVVTDITERKRAEEQLLNLNKDLESRVVARTEELAATIVNLTAEIAERESAEESLLRLNRLYLVLSETNHAIVCTKNRAALFEEFCRIAVEDGGFLLAWVGLLDQGSGQLQVAASFGSTGYLDGIKISANPEPHGQGPTGLSVQTGSYFICNDFLASPLTAPWHEKGATHGIRASASIPLQQEGKVIGALTLYADEKDFFDRQQVALLQQMGADFSFALDNIQREIQRQEVEQALLEQTEKRLQTVEALRVKEQMLIQQSRQAAMGEMISNIAHQWRQPLNTLALSIQELQLMHDLGECSAEFMGQSVEKSMGLIQHMSQTIDDFRNYFKPDKDKTEFNVSEAITSTLLLVEDSFKFQRVTIDIVTHQAPTIYGYRNEFAQSLLNILNNARDVLTERKIERPKVTVTISSAGGRAVVTVADNAGGIPPGIIEKIFDPYFTTKGPQSGTGLGLFMSKAIVEKNLGGRLTVRNTGDGAEFRIEI